MSVPYPKWLYSADRSLIVQDAAEHEALEGNWYESPADIPDTAAEAKGRDDLVAAAEAKGIKVDNRWSDKRIQAEIDKA